MVACATTGSVTTSNAPLAAVALPGATADGVGMDALAVDHVHHAVWVPAGNTGRVDVIEQGGAHVSSVAGFVTKAMERKGKTRTVGPSSIAIGDDVIAIGNRGDNSVCLVDASTHKKGACLVLDDMPDLVQYVAATHELWVTTPATSTIVVLDASTSALRETSRIHIDGEPEGTTVDDVGGLVYTNVADHDRTLALDVHTHAVVHNWPAHCGDVEPKGLVFDQAQHVVLVACAHSINALDAAHDGVLLSSVEIGDGVDLIDLVEPTQTLVVAAGRAATLKVIHVDAGGLLRVVRSVTTSAGARNAVVDNGVAYVADAAKGQLLLVPVPEALGATPAP
jgi:DNA-binding beta-propeller fold protein YncE